MSKKYTDITAVELKQILTFLNESIHNFSTFKIRQLPENGDWSTEHFSRDFSISLKIDRDKFTEL
jgi:hypothetical protein